MMLHDLCPRVINSVKDINICLPKDKKIVFIITFLLLGAFI